jgi:arginyl-tRNA synthetase
MIRQILKDSLTKALEDSGYKGVEPEILPTADQKFGDYYSTIALKLAKRGSKQTPVDAAKLLVAKLSKNEEIFTTEIAPNGFINFKITPEYLQSQVQKIIEVNTGWGGVKAGEGKKVQVEFISANPTGPLTLGNGRGGFTGDALANCLGNAGFKVEREYYINDTGNQIRTLGLSILDACGVKIESREGLYQGSNVLAIAKELKRRIDVERYKTKANELGEIAAELILEEFIKPMLAGMNIQFDKFVSEKGLHESGEINAALEMLRKKNLTNEKEGATWFVPKQGKTASIEDKDRVLVRSESSGDGAPTYFLADVAYHLNKFKRGYDKVINIWGADHAGYVPRMKLAMRELGFSQKLEIIITQLVRLVENGKEIRMSKRSGTYVTLEELVEDVGLDVARFFFISHAPTTHMDFDLKLAREVSNKNPVYYVQYAHARCNSILKKAQKNRLKPTNISKVDASLLIEPTEHTLISHMLRLPELVEDISKNYSVHLLPAYATGLADKLHHFYEQVRVIGEDKDTTKARLALIQAVKIALHNSLQLMGISAPEYMEKVGSKNESKAS